MLEMYAEILRRAETVAKETQDFNSAVSVLRGLPIEDFGLFFISLPNLAYPHLSRVLPPMASPQVQTDWTGAHGHTLYAQTSAFLRLIVSNYARYRQRSLDDLTIMDFGVGYGRVLRLMYYFSNPDKLWGVDAWEKSLEHCKNVGMPGHFALSDAMPEKLPVGDVKFDLIYSLSVFTHLAPGSAAKCLSALRHHIAPDGCLMLTIRPIEFWPYYDASRGIKEAARLQKLHRSTGIAYLPHNGEEGATYGDTSFATTYFDNDEWKLIGIDRSVADPYQLLIILEPR
jgi:SAM-dependent methyltransferase